MYRSIDSNQKTTFRNFHLIVDFYSLCLSAFFNLGIKSLKCDQNSSSLYELKPYTVLAWFRPNTDSLIYNSTVPIDYTVISKILKTPLMYWTCDTFTLIGPVRHSLIKSNDVQDRLNIIIEGMCIQVVPR